MKEGHTVIERLTQTWRQNRYKAMLRDVLLDAQIAVDGFDCDHNEVVERLQPRYPKLSERMLYRAARLAAMQAIGDDIEGLELETLARSCQEDDLEEATSREAAEAALVFMRISVAIEKGKSWLMREMNRAEKQARGQLSEEQWNKVWALQCKILLLNQRIREAEAEQRAERRQVDHDNE
jgi:hypothetical protein